MISNCTSQPPETRSREQQFMSFCEILALCNLLVQSEYLVESMAALFVDSRVSNGI
jgi:hypothetical protein